MSSGEFWRAEHGRRGRALLGKTRIGFTTSTPATTSATPRSVNVVYSHEMDQEQPFGPHPLAYRDAGAGADDRDKGSTDAGEMGPGPFSPQQGRPDGAVAAAAAAQAGSRPTKRGRGLHSDMAQEEGSTMIKRRKQALGLFVQEKALVSDDSSGSGRGSPSTTSTTTTTTTTSRGGSASPPTVDPPQDKAISATGARVDKGSDEDSFWESLGCLDGVDEEEEIVAPINQEPAEWSRWNGTKPSSPETMGPVAGAGSPSSIPSSSSSPEAAVTPADHVNVSTSPTVVS